MPVLNTADKLYLGSSQVSAVYKGTTKTWPAFSPASLSGLVLWLDPAVAPTSTTWTDKSGTNNHVNVVGSPAPVVVTEPTANNQKVVRFTVSEGRIRKIGTGFTNTYTSVHVTRTRNTIGRGLGAIYPGPFNSNCLTGTHSAGYDAFYDDGWVAQDSWPSTPTPWKLYTVVASLAASSEKFYVNGTYKGQKSPSASHGDTIAISGYAEDTAAETCDIDVGEVIFYNRPLTDPERGQIEGYMKTKYGIS